MRFSDIHIHALYGCDDGARTVESMYQMIDAAYTDGTRYMCLTPHYNPGYFGENFDKTNEAFQLLTQYTRDKYPDLHITLGNELRYHPGCEEWLADGKCRSMNNSKYVLVDFFETESKNNISAGLEKLLSAGYIPVLAHAERYRNIRGNVDFIKEQRDNGVLIQMDTGSVLGRFGRSVRRFSKKMLRNYMVDFVSSDAHGMRMRPPGMNAAYNYIEKKFGTEYAEKICLKNVMHIIFGY